MIYFFVFTPFGWVDGGSVCRSMSFSVFSKVYSKVTLAILLRLCKVILKWTLGCGSLPFFSISSKPLIKTVFGFQTLNHPKTGWVGGGTSKMGLQVVKNPLKRKFLGFTP